MLLAFDYFQITEKKHGIEKIVLETRAPADRHNVLMWEQRNTVFLPDDLKSFYLTSDGFDLTWSVKMDSKLRRIYLFDSGLTSL